MSFEQVNPINNNTSGNHSNKVEQDRSASMPAQVQLGQQLKSVASKSPEPPIVEPKVETQSKASVMNSDVHLKFIVDDQSKDVTVLVVDRATQKVVRAIPPEELNQYKDGDLLSLFA